MPAPTIEFIKLKLAPNTVLLPIDGLSSKVASGLSKVGGWCNFSTEQEDRKPSMTPGDNCCNLDLFDTDLIALNGLGDATGKALKVTSRKFDILFQKINQDIKISSIPNGYILDALFNFLKMQQSPTLFCLNCCDNSQMPIVQKKRVISIWNRLTYLFAFLFISSWLTILLTLRAI